jgi:hypothetical protein
MPKSTGFDGIETAYPVLSLVPANNEIMATVAGVDYNVTFNQVFDIAVLRGLPAATASALAGQLDAYITGGGGGGGNSFALLDEDDFASNSAIAAPSQQSTKVYVDTATASNATTNAKLADMAQNTIKGRITASTGDPEDLTATQVRTIINVENGATGDQTVGEIVALLEGTPSLSYTAIDDLGSVGAGALYETALIASTSIADGSYLKRSGTDLVGQALGTAALIDAVPTGAPTAASSSAGAITLNYSGKTTLETTTTENITAITFSNIVAYTMVLWRVKHTTARTITFPAGTKITSGVLAYAGTANSTVNILIYNDNGTYEVAIGDPLPVGA